ncbi:maleylpyruvate isomerase family mycothiol-dependent enzyme [Rhodococcus sp. 1168]|uniref:maleylpyruvate isomerase family mycothiol-dependent enzyme n=1 Tax=Rhodococcus sp. 1168 TaxID=2018041 RepID=UPI000B5AD792|nr:maleylpyruvate isomerase family mycothiol-dependent enzyme [Rhodococcus sp. 1168]
MIDKDSIVKALVEEWASIDALVRDLDEDQWAATTPCPGWSVHNVIAHIVGTELSLAGQTPPGSDIDVSTLAHVHNDMGVLNEKWIQAFSLLSPAELIERFRTVTGDRARTLEAMSDEDFAAPSWTPAGQATYGRFMRIRVFDCWMHEQDIRDAIGTPGGMDSVSADYSVDEIVQGLGYIVGKLGKAPDGSSVTFDLTGSRPRRAHVDVTGRAQVVEELAGPATVTIVLPTGDFTRLCGGRIDASVALDRIETLGDEALGLQIVQSLAFTK